jgi:nicotinic acid phosphoribosyltransferase
MTIRFGARGRQTRKQAPAIVSAAAKTCIGSVQPLTGTSAVNAVKAQRNMTISALPSASAFPVRP